MVTVISDHFNFTKDWMDWGGCRPPMSINTICKANYERKSIDTRKSIFMERSQSMHAFYCKKSITFKGSHWIKWITPFKLDLWLTIIATLVVLHAVYVLVYKVGE